MKKLRLNSVFSDWMLDGGIFHFLQNTDVPWKDAEISKQLDLYFHGNVAGERIISPLVRKILVDDALTDDAASTLANIIFSIYGKSWQSLYDTLSFEYNPIQNYSMTEIMDNDNTVTEYGKEVSHSGSDTSRPDLSVETEQGVYGFNSTTAVNSDIQSQKSTGSQSIEYGSKDTDSGSDTTTRNYKLTREGNIGVTTSQQMIQSERDLWLWNFFLDVVFPNVRDVLTIYIY